MESALVLISAAPSFDKEILDELKELPNVIEAHYLYGPYDIYAKIEAEAGQDIQDLLFDKIRNIRGITSTMTCFIAD